MKLFVYGTLKAGGGNHGFLTERSSKFVCHHEMHGFELIDLGYGFPYMMIGNDSVLGEVYEIDRETLVNIDSLEGHPFHYKRYLTNFNGQVAEMYYYLSRFDIMPTKAKIVKDGYWPIDNQKIDVIIDGREYRDKAHKIVFNMRFFDGDRTPTNRSYMELVSKRSHIKLNTENEEIFVRQCITRGIYEGLNPFIYDEKLVNSNELKITE